MLGCPCDFADDRLFRHQISSEYIQMLHPSRHHLKGLCVRNISAPATFLCVLLRHQSNINLLRSRLTWFPFGKSKLQWTDGWSNYSFKPLTPAKLRPALIQANHDHLTPGNSTRICREGHSGSTWPHIRCMLLCQALMSRNSKMTAMNNSWPGFAFLC